MRETLESVRRQEYRDYEVLVLDDGSTDDSASIGEAYDCRVLRQENRGLGATRRRMVEEAEGELVAFIDADDTWTPQHLETLVRALDETGACMAHSDCWYLYPDGRRRARDLKIAGSSDPLAHILPDNRVIASSAVFSRRAMLEAGNFVADTVRCSDWYGWFILAARSRFVHVPVKTVEYKVLPSSLANAGLSFHEAQRYVLEEKILPRFGELYGRLPPAERMRYEQLARKALGIALSSVAKLTPDPAEAKRLHRRALRLAPTVFRVWSRALRAAVRR